MAKTPENIPLHAITTKELRSFGFDMIDLGARSGKKYNSSEPHRHTYYELFLFTKTGGTHEIDFNNYAIEKNTLHFVSPGQIHKLNQKQDHGFVICFTEDFIAMNDTEFFSDKYPFFDNTFTPALKLTAKFAEETEALVRTIYLEFQEGGAANITVLQSYLNIILSKVKVFFLSGAGASTGLPNRNATVVKFKKLVNKWYSEHLEISRYASELNISANYLNALCREHEGKTATCLIQDRLILESKRLLYSSDMQIKEIAFYLNFENVPYFNRFFKKKASLTPLEFRNKFKA
jgi:AraC family transcriptional activator of pobA